MTNYPARAFNWDSIDAKEVIGTDPAAGATSAVTYTVAAGKRVKFMMITADLTTNAGGANRTVRLLITDGTTTLWSKNSPSVQAGGFQYYYSTGPGTIDVTVDANNQVKIAWPADMVEIPAGFIISLVLVAGGDAADNWSTPKSLLKEVPV